MYVVQSSEYSPVAYHQAQVKLYRLRQVRDFRGHNMSDHLDHHSDMINMTERAGGNLDGIPASIVATPFMLSLCGFFLQISHKYNNPDDITNYWNHTLAECQAIHNHTYEAYLAVSVILILERSVR